MAKKVVIASDTTCDLSQELIDRYQIKLIPLYVTLGGQTYLDGMEIGPDDIYWAYEKTGELPKTSAANIHDYESFFCKHTQDGSSLVLFTVSSELSSTYRNACIAAESFEDVYVVDSRNLSTGVGILALTAADMAAQGHTAPEIAQRCQELTDCVDVSFVMDDLEYMQKGGRCSAVTVMGANLLQIKPELAMKDGKLGIAKKRRGKYAATLERYIRDHLDDPDQYDLTRAFVTHAGCEDTLVQQCLDLTKSLGMFQEVHLTRAGSIISSHCGRNTLGVIFLRKEL